MKKIVIVVLFLFLAASIIFFLPSELYPQDRASDGNTEEILGIQDKIMLVQPSVCLISTVFSARVYDDNIEEWSKPYYYDLPCGSGFCINSETGYIITAGHNVDVSYNILKRDILDQYISDTYPEDYNELSESDWDTIFIHFKVEGMQKSIPDREIFVQFDKASLVLPEEESFQMRAELVELSSKAYRDVALLKIQPVAGKALSAALLADSSKAEILDPVKIIGYSCPAATEQENLNVTVTSGTLSGNIIVDGNELIQIQSQTVPGNSGGPVINSEGEIIGMMTCAMDESNSYLRPCNDLKITIGKIVNKTGVIEAEWEEGLLMYRQKHYAEAVRHFNNVLNLNNGHLLALEYKAKAQNNINNGLALENEENRNIAEKKLENTTIEVIKTDDVKNITKDKDTATIQAGRLLTIVFIFLGFLLVVVIVLAILLIIKKKNIKKEKADKVNNLIISIEEHKARREVKFEDTAKISLCSNCKAVIGENQSYCSQCGAKLVP